MKQCGMLYMEFQHAVNIICMKIGCWEYIIPCSRILSGGLFRGDDIEGNFGNLVFEYCEIFCSV